MLVRMLLLAAGVSVLGFVGAPFPLWALLILGGLWALQAPTWFMGVAGVVTVIFGFRPFRRMLVSSVIFTAIRRLGILPRISDTERQALEAGNVWVETEFFSGKPDLERLRTQPYPQLTVEEQAFIDGPVEELCGMTTDWDIWKEGDLPDEVWSFLKREGFLGMIIPKEYGGLGFSAMAHSQVVMKIGSRSLPLCVSTMVPNSLGPAELIVHYGTEEQKNYYLPRLARGEEMPAFALTEPKAGSDAASLTSSGVLFKGEDGKLYIRLQWNKRWITLAAISTLLGLAFRLKDPENLLGKGEDLGITCALIPTHLEGVVLGRRHDAMGVPFYNCPTRGENVVVPMDAIIGGLGGVGRGWQMLMECLAAGRGISLPSQCTGGAMRAMRVAGAHATVRRQFGQPIGKFEGVAEPLARIGGLTYLMEAARRYTLGAIDLGAKPPVVTAIAKYQFTELARLIVNDGMDILGGAAISRGPRNQMANGYIASPIGITVEGANILTRTLIIFGQGAFRAHPFAFREVKAIESGDLVEFDRVFWCHVGHVVRAAFRAVLLSVTRGHLATAPAVPAPVRRYYQKVAWASSTFAVLTDLAMGGLGGKLKIREKLTGRFADALSWLYMGAAVLRRFEAEGCKYEDRPFLDWAMKYSLLKIQEAFEGIYRNFDVPVLGWILAGPVRFLHRLNPLSYGPSDALGDEIAALIQIDGEQRERHTQGVFRPEDPADPHSLLERAFVLTLKADAVYAKVRDAQRNHLLPRKLAIKELHELALEKGIITQVELKLLKDAEAARDEAIQVDSFDLDEYRAMRHGGATRVSPPKVARLENKAMGQ